MRVWEFGNRVEVIDLHRILSVKNCGGVEIRMSFIDHSDSDRVMS